MFSIIIEKRDLNVSAENIRKSGKIPAVYYGPKEVSTPVVVSTSQFKEVWKKAGESSVVILKEGTKEHEALIHEVDVHPVTGEPRHADFYVVEKGKKVTVEVPIVFTGVSPAVKDKGGILIKVIREIQVEASLIDLPHEINVDISSLVEFDDKIQVKDINPGHGIVFKVNPDEIIASVSEAKEEVIETSEAIDMASIEVEAKGKEAKEGEESAGGDDKKNDSK